MTPFLHSEYVQKWNIIYGSEYYFAARQEIYSFNAREIIWMVLHVWPVFWKLFLFLAFIYAWLYFVDLMSCIFTLSLDKANIKSIFVYPMDTIKKRRVGWSEIFYFWASSSEFVSSSIPLWQILTAHAQPFRGAGDLAFCLKVPLDSLLIWTSSEGSGETARMRRLGSPEPSLLA